MGIEHRLTHDLTPEVAKRCLEKALEGYAARFPDYRPTYNWTGSDEVAIAFSAKGVTLKGGVRLRPGAMEIDLDVPFLLRPLKGTAIKVIEDEFRKWMQEAKAGRLA